MQQPVTELNENDVLLGKGSAMSMYIGNQRFRDIVAELRPAYTSVSQHRPKTVVARDLLNRIRSVGGRFLQLDEGAELVESAIEQGKWYEITEEKVLMDKCRQALRQKRKDPQKKRGQPDTETLTAPPVASQVVTSTAASALGADLLAAAPSLLGGFPSFSQNLLAILPPTLVASAIPAPAVSPLTLFQNVPPFALDPSLVSLFQQAHLNPLVLPQQQTCSDGASRLLAGAPPQHYAQETINDAKDLSEATKSLGHGKNKTCNLATAGASIRAPRDDSCIGTVTDDDVSDFLLSVLALSGRPRFTEANLEEERENMTDEERARTLADLFGKLCSVRRVKRARRDLDDESMTFLVKQMRLEIERTPVESKKALVEAEAQCREEEFSDARLEMFLRCMGVDVKMAAQRFVNYWECRREVFGPEKYLLPMTLGGALRDDLVAIEAGVFCLLPRTDVSGRQILYIDPSLHTREGYSSDSLVSSKLLYVLMLCLSIKLTNLIPLLW